MNDDDDMCAAISSEVEIIASMLIGTNVER